MRKPITALSATFCMVLFAAGIVADAQPAAKPSVAWGASVPEALKAAQAHRAPILCYVTAKHCGYCRKMERDTWSDAGVAAQIRRGFVPLKLHAARDAALVSALGVKAFPTTILFRPDGQAITSASGYLTPEQMAGLLAWAARPTTPSQHVSHSPTR